jgi:thioredoxin reductase
MRNTYAVLGLSLAGIAAALKLAESGTDVRVFELVDDVPLRAWYRVGINSHPQAGSVLEKCFLADLRNAGVTVEDGEYQLQSPFKFSEKQTHTGLRKFGGSEIEVSATEILLAPNGVVSAVPLPEGWMNLIGRGISEAVWSDGPYYRGKNVYVAGCSSWTVDQALLAASFQVHPVILCDSKLNPSEIPTGMTYLENTTITAWKVANHQLKGVIIRSNGADEEKDCDAVFLAPNLVTPHSVRSLDPSSGIRLAGIGVGIDPGDHRGLYASGLSAATKILQN